MQKGAFARVLGASLLAACTGTDPTLGSGPDATKDVADAGTTSGDAPTALTIGDLAALSLSPLRPFKTPFAVQRNDVAGVVHVTVVDAPTGVVVEPLDIGADAATGVLSMTAVEGAVATRGTITLRAAVEGGGSTTRIFPLVVRGKPGDLDTTKGGPVATGIAATAGSLAMDAQGRILVLGSSCALRRHDATGQLDASFKTQIAASDVSFASVTGISAFGCTALSTAGDVVAAAGQLSITTSTGAATKANLRGWVTRMSLEGASDRRPAYVSGLVSAAVDGVAKALAVEASGAFRLVLDGATADGTVPDAASKHELHVVDANDVRALTPSAMVLSASTAFWTFPNAGGARVFGTLATAEPKDSSLVSGAFLVTANPDFSIGTNGWTVDTVRKNQEATGAALDGNGQTIGLDFDRTNNRANGLRPGGGSTAWELPLGGQDAFVYPGASFTQVAADATAILALGIEGSHPFAARFDITGKPDAAFGTQGRIAYPGVEAASVLGVALQPDGAVFLFATNAGALTLARMWL